MQHGFCDLLPVDAQPHYAQRDHRNLRIFPSGETTRKKCRLGSGADGYERKTSRSTSKLTTFTGSPAAKARIWSACLASGAVEELRQDLFRDVLMREYRLVPDLPPPHS